MKWLKSILAFFGILFGGMQGGQGKIAGKHPRRIGVPVIALGFGLSIRFRWQYFVFLLWIPILSMGYGVDSTLGALVFHAEWAIRGIYALLVSLPFLIFKPLKWAISAVLLVIAYQVHAGSLGEISWFGDLLIEDICRFVVLAILIIVNVLLDKE